jgi:hypothetical protein
MQVIRKRFKWDVHLELYINYYTVYEKKHHIHEASKLFVSGQLFAT